MDPGRELDEQDLRDVLDGAALLGSGGGGPRAMGECMIDAILACGEPVRVVAPQDLRDDDLVVVLCDVGGSQQGSKEQPAATWRAFEHLCRVLAPREPTAIVPIEIGPENSLAPMMAAARAGLPVVDGDGAGRAVPRLGMTSFEAARLAITPATLAGAGGALFHFEEVASAGAMEDVMRPLLTIERGPLANSGGMGLWPIAGGDARAHIVAGGIERARAIGHALRTSQGDPLKTLKELLGNAVSEVARGRLELRDTGDEGFDRDAIYLRPADAARPLVTAYSINELLIAWSADAPAPLATAPDGLGLVTARGETFTLAEARQHVGEETILVGIQAGPAMHEPAVAELFRSALLELGYPGPFVPAGPGLAGP